ncbi:hypothetical protein FM038_002850 [Shewanella eurypsychrophilus]|uniref:Uncharacterized protein n=1 Tax=Shewanella eurypsychrophilus TaxID=2593656 RepID=A0ABX6V1L0_9GAMM|nr:MULTISPECIES: hypothetical protein [Shewanella]QFU21188.1 hypothetical protein FS418_04430 [Shewanella sp. YLB-09]QPG56479.1 hypothetical protein FM038_002850 [Shewanella eurypsychrophilus]
MNKSALISITLVAVAVAAAIGYQSLNSEPASLESASQKVTDASPVAQVAQSSAKPMAPVSMSAPVTPVQYEVEQEVQHEAQAGTMEVAAMSASEPQQDSKPSAVNDPSHPPRQAPNANRAPRSAPNANPEYAHHPRPGTEQPVSAPVSMPSQPSGN